MGSRRRGSADDGHRIGTGGRAGPGGAELGMTDSDLIELNEALAAQVLPCTRECGVTPRDFDRFNVDGSGI
jgi:hypothetical protein